MEYVMVLHRFQILSRLCPQLPFKSIGHDIELNSQYQNIIRIIMSSDDDLSVTLKARNAPFASSDNNQLDELESEYKICNKAATSKWLEFNKSCYVYIYKGGGEPRDKIAAFDLDQTIIKPKGRSKIPKSATDWQFFSIWTKQKIEQTIRDNHSRFLIFTNQNGVGLGIAPLGEVQQRIQLVTERINIPCTVFMAIQKDSFRKPSDHMYHLFRRSFNDNIEIDKKESFYCGDAIGYPSHSDADIEFARKLEIPFITPEKFIRGVKPKFLEDKK